MVDISTWPMARTMKLPDNCFGSRWAISLYLHALWGSDRWAISEMACSDRMVVWDVWVYAWAETQAVVNVQLKLGLKVPATLEESDGNEDLFASLGLRVGVRRRIDGLTPMLTRWPRVRKPVALQGRRLILFADALRREPYYVWCGMVVSELPREVPAWAV